MHQHVDVEFLKQFIRDEVSVAAVLRDLLGHLAQACPDCGEALAPLVDGVSEQATVRTGPSWHGLPVCDPIALRAVLPDPRYVGAFDGLEAEASDWSRRVRLEWRRARADLRVLLRLAPEERPARIRTARSRFRSRAFAELLLEEARRLCRTRPEESAELAGLVPVAVLWIPGSQGQGWAQSLELRAAAWRANALRMAGHLRASARAFDALRAHLEDVARTPAGDGSLLAEVSSLEASLRLDQQHWTAARDLLGRADALYRSRGEALEVAKVAIQRGIVELHAGELAEAIACNRQALAQLDADRETHLFLCALSNLLLALCDSGRYGEAESLLVEHEPVYRAHQDSWSRPLELWLRARIAAGVRRADEAEEHFLAARDEYVAAGDAYHAAVISLDLAGLYLEQGRHRELERLALVMRDVFASEGLAARALAAIALFQQAVATETLTVAAIQALRRQLARDGRRREDEPLTAPDGPTAKGDGPGSAGR